MERKTLIAGIALTGLVAGSAAVALNVPTVAAIVPVQAEQAVTVESVSVDLWGTFYTLPADYVAFYLDQGGLQHYGDAGEFTEETLAAIEAQLAAAPQHSALIVDAGSLSSDALTTILTTVTPTNGMVLANTNEEMQQWLTGVFPEVAGELSSQPIELVANAALTSTQSADELTWTVTDAVYQHPGATITVRVSTTDTTGEVRATVEAVLAGMNRG